jgi:hypothetical protein
MAKKVFLTLLVVLIIIQFIHPKKNIAAERTPQHIENIYPVPADVRQILSRACYDCHSDSTRYPWYARLQPVAWWLDHHIDEGKNELNFSQFGTYEAKRQAHKLEEVTEMVNEHHMPLESYEWMHSDAKLTAEEMKTLTTWADGLRGQIEMK